MHITHEMGNSLEINTGTQNVFVNNNISSSRKGTLTLSAFMFNTKKSLILEEAVSTYSRVVSRAG